MPARAGLTLTEAAVLGLLALEGERSGYDLLSLAHRSVAHVWSPAKSQLYATLERLARNGLVHRRDVAQSGRPDKHVYRLAAAGRTAFDEWMSAAGAGRDELVLKMFFGGLTDAATLVAHVEEYRASAAGRLEVLEQVDRHENTRRGHDFFHGLVLDLGLDTTRAAVAWADGALLQLRERAGIHFARGGADTA